MIWWFLIPVLVVAIVAAIVYILLDVFVVVPGAHFGVHLRFGKRTGRILEENLHRKWPLVDKVELFSTELDEIRIEAPFTSKDKLQLVLKGSLQYRPDARISSDKADLARRPEERQGRNTFYEMSEDIICKGIVDALKALLGGLGGIYDGEEFIKNRQAIGSMVNALLRLKEPPHLHHDKTRCNVAKCRFKERVDAKDLIRFYNSHWRQVKDETAEDTAKPLECSPIELRYGIDVDTFALSDVDFSEATKRAFEKKKQAEASKAAFASKLAMAKEVQEALPDASAQEALNAADVSLDSAIRKSVLSVEGKAGVLGGFLGKLGGDGK